MKLIVGLGNPGRSYAHTRHNVGWWVVDHLADVWHFDQWRRSFDAELCRGRLGAHDVRLLKPTTYMNLSGDALVPFLRDARLSVGTDLLVIVDDVALPVGQFRLRAQGSAGGHNGLKSIESAVGGTRYPRLRVGVGPPPLRERTEDLADYVLDRMGKEEKALVADLLPDITAAVESWMTEGIEKAMSRFNRRVDSGTEPPPMTAGDGTETP